MLGMRDLLDMVESWLMDDCAPEQREEYRKRLHKPVTKTDRQEAKRQLMAEAAAAMGGEIG